LRNFWELVEESLLATKRIFKTPLFHGRGVSGLHRTQLAELQATAFAMALDPLDLRPPINTPGADD